ncbi:MAG: fibrobacter succinogenes major paralogous domain-containing protein [Fibrobacter sp.]|nr:fibrobacter succinogenes major paralogous domain-containing protein [Fibrobacter sp.]
MKKRFALYGMFAAMAIFATACGDDSSSGPEEESSSSIEVEDESSSSVEEEGKSSAKEEGKSSAADKKSSSSEAKKGDSSSSEEATSSSSAVSSSSEITRSSDWDVNKLYCDVKVDGDLLTIEYGVGGVFEETVIQDASAPKVSITYEGSSCENIDDFDFIGNLGTVEGVSCEVSDCVGTNKWAKKTVVWTSEPSKSDKFLLLEEEVEASFCKDFMSAEVTTDYLNKKMFDEGKYGVMVDTRDDSYLIYRTIKIGNQTWMAQNLNYVTYDGNADDGVASWCYDDAESCAKYGRLYTWAAAMDKPEGSCANGHVCGMTGTVQGICPDGWHLPSKEELHELLNFASTEVDSTTNLGESVYDVAGTKLQTSGTNEYGFSALLTGYYDDEYCEVKNMTYFWSSSEKNADEVYMFYVGSDFESAVLKSEGKDFGQSVRCIKD